MDLSGKIIAVTGAAQGIGAATARLCAARGATVIAIDRRAEAIERVVVAIRAAGGQAEGAPADVRDDAAVAAAFGGIRARHGRLDALICAAGVLRGAYEQPEELAIDDWDLVLDVNVKGIFLCAKYATGLLEAGGRGVLVLLSSGGGVRGPSSSLAYGASKAGVHGLGLTMEARLAPRGIRVNVVCPGQIDTEMKLSVFAVQAAREGRSSAEVIDEARPTLGSPDGIAKLLAFLVSSEADYVRGTIFTR